MGLKNWFSRLNTQVWAASLPGSPEDAAQAVTEPLPPLFEFTPWPKTARLLRDIVITEKIDGTNAAILIKQIRADEFLDIMSAGPSADLIAWHAADEAWYGDDPVYLIGAQSRNRVISVRQDNQGFAKWVQQNAKTLVEDLGPGTHFGEFWGNKIGRGYGLPEGDRRFSLFNPAFEFKHTVAHADGDVNVTVIRTPGLDVVPVLYEGPLDTQAIKDTVAALDFRGSLAVQGYMNPEGIVVYHTHARRIIGKVTLDNQDAGKWES